MVAITPTSTGNGYWLVASDGGIFSFGDSTFYGSLPGLGFHPAGSRLPHSLNAPIVGMVPTFTGHGYFMVASDGGVFAFGDAQLRGLVPRHRRLRGCGRGRDAGRTRERLLAGDQTGGVYAFGDAPFYGAPTRRRCPWSTPWPPRTGAATGCSTPTAWCTNFGDAVEFGGPVGYVNAFNPAATIFPTVDGKGYWVASARGDVFSYGDSPYLGSMAAAGLNGEIIGGLRVLSVTPRAPRPPGAGNSATTAWTIASTPRPDPADALRSRSET